MTQEYGEDQVNSEGLTPNQEILAGMLFDTKTVAQVGRRTEHSDGTFTFEKIERPTSPVDFAQEGEFAMKEHEVHPENPLSPVYINLRKLPPEVLDQVGIVLAEMETGVRPDICSGVPQAGGPLAEAYSRHSGIPVEDVFDKEILEGKRRITMGMPAEQNKGVKLRIIDDLATRGLTKLEAIQAAEEMGFTVTDLVILVDRQQGAVEELAEHGYTLRSAFTIDQLLKFGVRTGRVSGDRYQEVKTYLGL